MSIKIAIVGDFHDGGGIQNHIQNLSTELLRKKNLDIHIISMADKSEVINRDNLKVHLIKEPEHSNIPVVSSFRYKTSSFLIVEKLIAINPDIVHVHGTYLPYSKVPVALKKLGTYPVILTMHGSMLQETKYTSRFPKTQLIYLKLLPNLYNKKKALKDADKIIAVSEPIRKIVDKIVRDKTKILTIPNGVNFTYFKDNQNTVDLLHPSILFVGRLVKVKGCDTLLKAIPLIKNFIPNIHLYVAGDGTQRKKLEELANKLDLSNNITFLGYLSKKNLNELYNSVDLYVIPSKFEACPSTILEAMACAKPVIASNVGGIPSIVADTETGYLFSPNDVHDLAIKIVKLLKNGKLLIELGEKGRDKVRTEFDWEVIAESVLNLYIECLHEHRNKNC